MEGEGQPKTFNALKSPKNSSPSSSDSDDRCPVEEAHPQPPPPPPPPPPSCDQRPPSCDQRNSGIHPPPEPDPVQGGVMAVVGGEGEKTSSDDNSGTSVGPNSTLHESSEYSADQVEGGEGEEGRGEAEGIPKAGRKRKGREKKKSGATDSSNLDRKELALEYILPEYRFKWEPRKDQKAKLTAKYTEQVKNRRLKSVTTELQVLPDVTEEDGQRVTKLVLTLSLSTNTLQELVHSAEVEAILHHPAALSVLGETARRKYPFAPGGDHVTIVVDLADREAVERSRDAAGLLEVIVRVKVNGYRLQSGYECSGEQDGFVVMEKTKKK